MVITVNGTKTDYYYNGSILAGQKTGSTTLVFMYDNNGDTFGFIYGGKEYYYVKNLQNDVTAITNSTGKVIANYYYDSWGNITSITGNTTIANINPLRYRTYYYDTETNLYYLNSRYYAPDMCRFLNVDCYIQTGQGILDKNMFAYCLNSPVNRIDSDGKYTQALPNTDELNVLLEALGALMAAAPEIALLVALLVVGSLIIDSVVSNSKTNYKNDSSDRIYTVYHLVDEDEQVQYVGRTKNPKARKKAHENSKVRGHLTFDPIDKKLTLNEARGLEQLEMLRCHTINTANKMNNQINGVSPNNPNKTDYAIDGFLVFVSLYTENAATNEILCWLES